MIYPAVFLYDKFIGYFFFNSIKEYTFNFSEHYFEEGVRPILGQYFEDHLNSSYKGSSTGVLPAFFDNLLPEGALKEFLLARYEIEPNDPISLLKIIGLDLPGALEIREIDGENYNLPKISDKDFIFSKSNVEDNEALDGMKFSLAGVQLKFSVLNKENKWTLPLKENAGNWIIKFSREKTFPGVVENEFCTMSWAKLIGFDVPEFFLLDYHKIDGLPEQFSQEQNKVFAIKRFDRVEDKKLHQEDFAQICNLPSRLKYHKDISYLQMAVLSYFILGSKGLEEFIRRLIFSIASGNGDAHLKNWSLLYKKKTLAEWSPLYDQVSTVMWEQLHKDTALTIEGGKSFYTIDEGKLKRFSLKIINEIKKYDEDINIDNNSILEWISETVHRCKESWKEVKEMKESSHEYIKAIEQHWKKTSFLKNRGLL